MVKSSKNDGPRDVVMSVCISRRLNEAIRTRAARTGESRSELLYGLICPIRQQELLSAEESRPTFQPYRAQRIRT